MLIKLTREVRKNIISDYLKNPNVTDLMKKYHMSHPTILNA